MIKLEIYEECVDHQRTHTISKHNMHPRTPHIRSPKAKVPTPCVLHRTCSHKTHVAALLPATADHADISGLPTATVISPDTADENSIPTSRPTPCRVRKASFRLLQLHLHGSGPCFVVAHGLAHNYTNNSACVRCARRRRYRRRNAALCRGSERAMQFLEFLLLAACATACARAPLLLCEGVAT
jgi:hypothetical protein